MIKRISNYLVYGIFLVLSILFGVLSVNTFNKYSDNNNITYEQLMYEELTFQDFEYCRISKQITRLLITFKEYEEPFYISDVTMDAINKDALNSLSSGDVLKVYYANSNHRDYTYDIYEFRNDNFQVMMLKDYIRVNKGNDLVGVFVLAFLSIISFGVFIYLIILFNNKYYLYHLRKSKDKDIIKNK